jgi:hypothetical protein
VVKVPVKAPTGPAPQERPPPAARAPAQNPVNIPLSRHVVSLIAPEGTVPRDLERADAALRSSLDVADLAADQQRRADQIRRHLDRGDHPVTIKLRLQRTEAELRKLQRTLRSERAAGREPGRRLQTAATSRAQEVDLDRAALAALAARGVTRDWGPDDFQPGDHVQFHGLGWYEVRKVNRTSLTVPSHVGGDWTDTVTYAKVVARSRAGVTVTAGDLLETVNPLDQSASSDESSMP